MPVARNTWQPSLTLKPASAVRRRTIGVDAVHRLVGEHAGFAEHRAEEGGLAVLADLRGVGSGPSMREAVIFREHDRRLEPLAASLCAPGRKQPVRFPCAHRYETGSATEA